MVNSLFNLFYPVQYSTLFHFILITINGEPQAQGVKINIKNTSAKRCNTI